MQATNLNLVTTIPDNKEHWLEMRSRNINSTEVASLFGLSPYLTRFELWHRQKGNVVADFQANERSLWGNRLEDAIAQASAEERGWKIRKAPEYVQCPDLRIGSSFDYIIQEQLTITDKDRFEPRFLDEEILEIKNVDSLVFKDGWLVDDDGDIEAPPHIELQIQTQMIMKPEVKRTVLRALIGGNRMVEIVRERDPEIIAAILQKVQEFWHSIDNNIEPSADFSLDDETLRKLYGYAEPGKVVDMTGDAQVEALVNEYNMAQEAFKLAEERKKAAKGELLTLIGDAEKVLGNGFSISAGVVGDSYIEAHTRAGYRGFRIYKKKVK